MLFIRINNKIFIVKKNISILEACKFVGINIPRFCYHESLSIAGNCRMCLVELELNANKPVSSCTLPISDELQILTDTPFIKKARENVLETLLLNHPLDCPICDQAGECDLQDQAKNFGTKTSRFFFNKRTVEDKFMGSLIKTIMTRCIHCTRCVRFSEELLGKKILGTLNRGQQTEIGTYTANNFDSVLSGNVIDLCPVGALTSKVYAFKARPWELKILESIDLLDSWGIKIFISIKESEVIRITPKKNNKTNSLFITDKSRFSFDANNILRLEQPLTIKNDKKIENNNWFFLSKQLNLLNKNNLFIISEDLDYKFLLKASQLQNIGNVQFRSLDNINNTSNLYINTLFSSALNWNFLFKLCFILSSNLKIENAIINLKLRSFFLKRSLNIISTGFFNTLPFPTLFLSFNFKKLSFIFEAKAYTLSNIIMSNLNIIFLIGASFKFRLLNLNFFFFFKKIFPSIKFIFLNKASNTEAAFFLNIQTLNTNIIKKTNNIFYLDLCETLKLNKLFFFFPSKLYFWLNSHGPIFFTFFNFLFPITSLMEREGVFINIEGKAQKVFSSLINLNTNILILEEFLILFFKNFKKQFYKKISAFSFFFDISQKFISSSKNLTLFAKYFNLEIHKYQKYPFKPLFEDFYRTNNFCKNSIVMYKRSKEIRLNSNNFFN